MADTRKTFAKKMSWSDPDQVPSHPYSDGDTVAETKSETTGERTLDRWFLEQRGKKRVPKRLDIANEMLVTSGGPLKTTGNITLIDEDGTVSHHNELKLCRCGASRNKPFCDDRHLDIEFFDNGAVTRMSDWMSVKRPQTVTLTCVKNGPLKFRGYLRIYNSKGQECITMNGALCRCGQSSKKPFCDNRHGCLGD